MKKNKLCHRLPAYYDGQLHGDEVDVFYAHMKTCPVCPQELKKLNRLSDFIRLGQGSAPENRSFDVLWGQVEGRLIRTELSFIETLKNYRTALVEYITAVFKPLVAVCFVLLLVLLPLLEQKDSHLIPVLKDEAQIKRIDSRTGGVMLFKTKEKKWTVMWIVPKQKQEEYNVI